MKNKTTRYLYFIIKNKSSLFWTNKYYFITYRTVSTLQLIFILFWMKIKQLKCQACTEKLFTVSGSYRARTISASASELCLPLRHGALDG